MATHDNDMIRTVVVGSGNVAEAVALAVAGCDATKLVQIAARNAARAAEVAAMAGCSWTADLGSAADADIYIIAVSDRAVGEVAAALHCSAGSIVLHTAGSVEIGVLYGASENEEDHRGGKSDDVSGYGVLYPFQTFTSGRRIDFSEVPIFIEGSDEIIGRRIERFARLLSRHVEYASSERRRAIHLAGVMGCNFVNALYCMAADWLAGSEGLPFGILRPLIAETARKAAEAADPQQVQTGPAVRGDRTVAERHIRMLEKHPREQLIYRLLTEYIWETSKKI